MRGSLLTVLAGVTAAFCFASIFIHFMAGQFFFPLATLPLFLVLFMAPFREIWLALAASGATLGFMGFSGVFGPSALLGILLSFALTAALPAVIAGGIYTTPIRPKDDEPSRWVPAEVPFMVLCLLGVVLFYTVSVFAHFAVEKSLYTVFYDIAHDFIKTTHDQLKAMNPDMDPSLFNIEELTKKTTLRMSGFVVFLFVLGHFANLLIAQWALSRKALIAQPMPHIGSFYFPFALVTLLSLLCLVSVLGLQFEWSHGTLFMVTPLVVAAALPLLLQGVSAMHRFLVKKLVKPGVVSVYLGFTVLLITMPIQIYMIF